MKWHTYLRFVGLVVVVVMCFWGHGNAQPFMANGVKIGEVTSTTAMIWSRLTQLRDRNLSGVPFQIGDIVARSEMPKASSDDPYWNQLPKGKTLGEMVNAVSGSPGFVRVTYWPVDEKESHKTVGWVSVKVDEDFTYQFELVDLKPGTKYGFKVEGSGSVGGKITSVVESDFMTAPAAGDPAKVVFVVISCGRWKTMDHPDGHDIYPQMAMLDPHFFVHAGDIVYYDHTHPYASHVDLARFRWHRMYALPRVRDFHNQIPSYFMRDDHDTWQNDCWPGQESRMGNFTLAEGQAVFREQTAMSPKTYRTVRWGKDLQVWFSEGRDYRSANTLPDGPEKTIWGQEQMAWFKRTVAESDATFKILISPSPIVGPDHDNKWDNHSNPNFSYEGNLLRDFLSANNMTVICGDRHWQYASQDTKTGLMEYGCGATTDRHSIMIKNDDLSMMKYVAAIGGFLGVTVERVDGTPRAVFRHYDVPGQVVNEAVQVLE